MKIDVRGTADAAAEADGSVDGEDRFLPLVLNNELRRTFAESNHTIAQC